MTQVFDNTAIGGTAHDVKANSVSVGPGGSLVDHEMTFRRTDHPVVLPKPLP